MISGRLVLKGEVTLKSPALIGSGANDSADIDILKDAEGRPYIPATSMIGVLRTVINGVNLDRFWGYTKGNDSAQSAIRCDDLNLIDSMAKPIEVRDGIKIDPKTGIVEDKAKYDYEIIPAGTGFHLLMEAPYNAEDKDTISRMLKTIEQQLSKGAVSIGAKTNSGLGRIRLEKPKLYDFNYSKKQDVLRWLKEDFSSQPECTGIEPYEIKNSFFSIDMTLRLKSSLIVRSYSSSPDAPDAVHMKSGNDYVIPGTSLKGAIRARAERISRTIHNSDKILEDLFGFVYEDGKEAIDKGKKKGDAKKGRIKIDEVTLPKFVSELQTRIKIDRFTGGTIESALLETMPLFATRAGQEDIKNVRISINEYKDYEAGLMLLVLKDLWTGDIAVGGERNIGRGVFEGIRAEIKINGKAIVIDNDLKSIKPEDMKELESLVSSFINYTGGEK